MSKLLTPPLSTISFPSHDMGSEAVKILIGHMNGTLNTPQQILLRLGLIIRGSTVTVRAQQEV